MLSLTDARDGVRREVARPRSLVVLHTCGPALSAAVAGDAVRRTLAARRVRVELAGPGPGAATLAQLNVWPAGDCTAVADRCDVVVTADVLTAVARHRAAGLVLHVPAVELDPPAPDPLGGRLALLEGGTDGVAASELLHTWRRAVAQWAESPSGPPQAARRARVLAALEDGLDTVSAVAELAELATDRGAPDDGVRFETAAALDVLLGLDLTRCVGAAP